MSLPEFQLWIKASHIDKMSKGACPQCQLWYMASYILAKEKRASFSVITTLESSIPKILKDKSSSGLFPVVVGVSGETSLGDITDIVADESTQLESFFNSFKCPALAMNTGGQKAVLDVCGNLYRDFNLFLKNPTDKTRAKLNTILSNFDDYLSSNETLFADGDSMTFADCVILPRLQHLRIAGKTYCNFEILSDLKYVWRYLSNAYESDVFRDTIPSDPTIISHYEKKIQNKSVKPALMKDVTTLNIPDHISLELPTTYKETYDENDDFETVTPVEEQQTNNGTEVTDKVESAPYEDLAPNGTRDFMEGYSAEEPSDAGSAEAAMPDMDQDYAKHFNKEEDTATNNDTT